MKLHRVTSTVEGRRFTEFASSADGASRIKTRLKKLGALDFDVAPIELDNTRDGLIKFLNTHMAHSSHVPAKVAKALKDG